MLNLNLIQIVELKNTINLQENVLVVLMENIGNKFYHIKNDFKYLFILFLFVFFLINLKRLFLI